MRAIVGFLERLPGEEGTIQQREICLVKEEDTRAAQRQRDAAGFEARLLGRRAFLEDGNARRVFPGVPVLSLYSICGEGQAFHYPPVMP